MQNATIPLRGPLLRGARRPRVALVGRRRTGKSSIFRAASSPAVQHERLAGVGGAYEECLVDVGLDQISLVDLPDMEEDDELLQQAMEIIRQTRRASTSALQRRLSIGYTRAARIMDLLEQKGVVGPTQGANPRDILIDLDGEVPDNNEPGPT